MPYWHAVNFVLPPTKRNRSCTKRENVKLTLPKTPRRWIVISQKLGKASQAKQESMRLKSLGNYTSCYETAVIEKIREDEDVMLM